MRQRTRSPTWLGGSLLHSPGRERARGGTRIDHGPRPVRRIRSIGMRAPTCPTSPIRWGDRRSGRCGSGPRTQNIRNLKCPTAYVADAAADPAYLRSNNPEGTSAYSHVIRDLEIWLPWDFAFTFRAVTPAGGAKPTGGPRREAPPAAEARRLTSGFPGRHNRSRPERSCACGRTAPPAVACGRAEEGCSYTNEGSWTARCCASSGSACAQAGSAIEQGRDRLIGVRRGAVALGEGFTPPGTAAPRGFHAREAPPKPPPAASRRGCGWAAVNSVDGSRSG